MIKKASFAGIGLAAMAGITALFSLVGIDAWWVNASRAIGIRNWFGYAGMIGFFMPVAIWATLLIAGIISQNKRTTTAAWIAAASGFLGWFASSFLKFFTGRPGLRGGTDVLEWSQTFRFGFGEGGIFWGWPSSHTTVAVAMSVALLLYYRDKKWVGVVAILYAAFIAIGATGFHWLSDVVAGVILGTIIGFGVVKSFNK